MNEGVPRLVVVTGLSGAGKNSVLRALEDSGYEAVDNPPLRLVETLARSDRPLAVGIDARTRDFSARAVVATLDRLHEIRGTRPELLFLSAATESLQRRFSETRRRHPLALSGTVGEGIETERALLQPLRDAADWTIDTSGLSLSDLRQMIERHFGPGGPGMAITLVSFGFPSGLPREADLVLDSRFLRNPHYIPDLRPKTGLDPEVRAYIASDPEFPEFFDRITGLINFLLPRFARESKKYAMIAVGCTGGRHRSVSLVEMLGSRLRAASWSVLTEHRNLQAAATTSQAIRKNPDIYGVIQ